MKQIICGLIVVVLSTLAPRPALSYVVYFKNGSTMEVQSHRLEGGKVYLKLRGGEASFDVSQVDMDKTNSDYAAYNSVIKKAGEMAGMGDYAGAVKLYQSITSADPEDVQARFLLGRVLTGAKRFDEAVGYFQKSLEIDPKFARAYFGLASLYQVKGQREQAIRAYRKVLDAGAPRVVVLPGLGLVPDACILPHHATMGLRWLPMLSEELRDSLLIGIDESTAMIRQQGTWTVYGGGRVTLYPPSPDQPRISTVYASGDIFRLPG